MSSPCLVAAGAGAWGGVPAPCVHLAEDPLGSWLLASEGEERLPLLEPHSWSFPRVALVIHLPCAAPTPQSAGDNSGLYLSGFSSRDLTSVAIVRFLMGKPGVPDG